MRRPDDPRSRGSRPGRRPFQGRHAGGTAHGRRGPGGDAVGSCKGRIPPRRGVAEEGTGTGSSALLSFLVATASREIAAVHPERARAVLRLLPRAVTHPGPTWLKLGRLHLHWAQFEDAGQAFGHAAAYRPRDAGLQAQLARICLELDDIPSFEGYLGRALALDPTHPDAVELVAEVNRDHGDPAFAAVLFSRLLLAKPRHRGYRRSLAQCLSQLGPVATAINLLLHRRTDASAAPSIPLPGSIVGPPGARRARPRPSSGGADEPGP